MGQELQVPAIFLQKGISKAFQGKVNAQEDNLADGIGQSYPVIAYKGKIWALRHRGERKIVPRPDDGSPSGHLDVVILEQAKGKSRSFYKKYDANTSEGDRPICASMDGVVPDSDVTQKQSESCAVCIRNVWKVDAQTGRKGRECSEYKRLAVLVHPNQSAAALGAPLSEPMFLRVPPDSLNSLAIMGEVMGNQDMHYSTYWTRITFDPVKAHPSMVFRPDTPVEDRLVSLVLELRNSPTVARITGGEVALQGPKLVQQPVTATAAPGAPVFDIDQPPAGPAPEVPNRGRPVGSKNKPKVAPVQTVQAVAPAPGNGHDEEETLDMFKTPDEGVTEASDDELDAEIARMIANK
jgi:hypothetical protein